MAAPPTAAATVIIVGALTPGYDFATRTVSRLAVPGMPGAAAVDAAMVLVAVACAALALGFPKAPSLGRVALAVAAIAFIGTALVHLDPASAGATAVHRILSGVAVSALTIAPFAFARTYGVTSFATGIAELVMLAIGLALLGSPVVVWGAWERLLLAIPLAWIVLVAATRASTEATTKTNTATLNSTTS